GSVAGKASAVPSRAPLSGGEEPVEERAVACQRDPQVLRRDVVTALPLAFEPISLVGEARCKSLHEVGDKRVGFLDRFLRLVDEVRLDLLPAGGEAIRLVGGQLRLALVEIVDLQPRLVASRATRRVLRL